jgi:ATP-dependent Clp protease ATP-binding subunit ClpC
MRKIIEKELAAVLERRGLRQRDWAVEYEDSAITFLLDKGFSADMGARPLRRAIDQYFLAPLAATLVEHRYPAGDQFLFVRSDGDAIQVEFVDPDAENTPASTTTSTATDTVTDTHTLLARAILGAAGTRAESNALVMVSAEIDARVASSQWVSLKDDLAGQIGDDEIWAKSDRAGIFSRYEQMDRVLEARRTAERLRTRLDSSRNGRTKISRELTSRLALQLYLVGLGISDALTNSPVDVLVRVEPVSAGSTSADASREWCDRLIAMYRSWAKRRRMRIQEVQAPRPNHTPILSVAGFGSFAILNGEAGLHVWEEGRGTRLVARVRVAPGPANDPPMINSYSTFDQLLAQSKETTAIVRRYRREPDMLVRDALRDWRSGKLDAVLAGDFDLVAIISK